MTKHAVRVVAAVAAIALTVTVAAGPAAAAPGDIVTIAGTGTAGFSGDGGPAASADLADPRGVADSGTALYVADTQNHRVRLVDGGLIETVAGTGAPGFVGNGETPTAAQLNDPHGLAVDAFGTVYVADRGNHAIRSFTLGGTLDTIAGTLGTAGTGGDGGPATSATLNGPTDVAVDLDGFVYVADRDNHRIRRIEPGSGGLIETVVGTGTAGFSGDGGPGNAAQLSSPTSVEVGPDGRIYIADEGNHRIRVWDVATDTVSTFAGTGAPGFSGDGGPAAAAQLQAPGGLGADESGNVYFVDRGNQRVRRVGGDGVIFTVAGTGAAGYNGDGIPAESAQVNVPYAVEAVAGTDDLYIADSGNARVRLVTDATDVPAGAAIPLALYAALVAGGAIVGVGVVRRRRATDGD